MKKRIQTKHFDESKGLSFRIGERVPEDKLGLAYIQTPEVEVDDVVSMTDDSYISENIIPDDFRDSLMIANEKGQLEYINKTSGSRFTRRDPGISIPSSDFAIARRFYKDDARLPNALFYKIEIEHHYDSLKSNIEPGKLGEEIEYEGTQIVITDEFNEKIQNEDNIFYQTYIIPDPKNNHISKVVIYISKRTDEELTFKVRYNHIDQVVSTERIHSVKREIQFYTGEANTIEVYSNDKKDIKQMLESGKIRILNMMNNYQEATRSDVLKERAKKGKKDEIYHIEYSETERGYIVTVPEVTIEDNRKFIPFTYRVVAEYEDNKGREFKYMSGYVTDVIMHINNLLPFEERDYMEKYKRLGIPKDGGFINSAKEMLDLSLPNGIDGIPLDSKIYIEDDKGDILYYIKDLTDDPDTETILENDYAYAKNDKVPYGPMPSSEDTIYFYENKPQTSRFSIIPEVQEKEWDFEFEVDATGYIEEEVKIEGTWKIGAILREKSHFKTNELDVADKTQWQAIGSLREHEIRNEAADKSNLNSSETKSILSDVYDSWGLGYDNGGGRNGLTFHRNEEDVIGFYQTRRPNGDGSFTDMYQESDYEFSVRVRMNDFVDDDAVAILFRLTSPNHYYMFVWDKNEIAREILDYAVIHKQEAKDLGIGKQGTARVHFDHRGYQASRYDKAFIDERLSVLISKDLDEYLTKQGFGENHKRIFRATKSNLKRANTEQDWIKNKDLRFYKDRTKTSFHDITIMEEGSQYNPKGWMPGIDYRITLVARGNNFKIHITENLNSKDKGPVVCRAIDDTYPKGTYGIATISQRWTYWDQLKIEEVQDITLYSEEFSHTFEKKTLEKMTEERASAIMKEKVDEFIRQQSDEGKEYMVVGYVGASTDTTVSLIDGETIFAKPNEKMQESIKKNPWSTKDGDLTIKGKGKVTYHEDGYLDIEYSPQTVPSRVGPEEVQDFKWGEPVLTGGHSVNLKLSNQKYILAEAEIPPIRQIGKIYHSKEHDVAKSDYIKEVDYLFRNASALRKTFSIPENIKLRDVMLRLEKGHVTSVETDGTTHTSKVNHLVNYRFKTDKKGLYKYPIDQHVHEVGANRLRVSMLLDISYEEINSYDTSVVAWTHVPNVIAYPLFAIKVHEKQRIVAEKPRVESETQRYRSWYPRVKDGKLIKRIKLPSEGSNPFYKREPALKGYAGKEVDVIYSTPEFEKTEHLSEIIQSIQNEKPLILNQNQIKVKHVNLLLHPEDEKSEESISVYVERDNERKKMKVSDVDASKGIIYLHDDILESDLLEVSYSFYENWYTYKGFTSQKKQKFNLDLNPSSGHTYTVSNEGIEQSVPYPESEKTYSLKERESKELLSQTAYLYMIPQEYYTVKGDLITKTKLESSLYHTFKFDRFDTSHVDYDPTLFLLSRMNDSYNYKAFKDSIVVDVRQRGGGLKRRVTDRDIQRISRDALSNWDIGHWDGKPYQENGVVLIRVSDKVIRDKSEERVLSEIEEVVNKYKAYGIHAFIEFYSESSNYERSIIRNHEFLGGEHCGYFYAEDSYGNYEIIKEELGGYDDYMLKLDGVSQYAIRIPGHQFTIGEDYEVLAKARRASGSPDRRAYQTEIVYMDGSKEKFYSNSISYVNTWGIYTKRFTVKKKIKYVNLILGEEKTGEEKHSYYYDYMIAKPVGMLTSNYHIHDK